MDVRGINTSYILASGTLRVKQNSDCKIQKILLWSKKPTFPVPINNLHWKIEVHSLFILLCYIQTKSLQVNTSCRRQTARFQV